MSLHLQSIRLNFCSRYFVLIKAEDPIDWNISLNIICYSMITFQEIWTKLGWVDMTSLLTVIYNTDELS